MSQILRMQTSASDPVQAVQDIKNAFRGNSSSLILFFCSHSYPFDTLATAMNEAFPDTQVCGCSAGGEIGPEGYLDQSITAISFPKDDFSISIAVLENLQSVTEEKIKQFVQSLIMSCSTPSITMPFRYSFAVQLIDGLTCQEEKITHLVQKYLGRTQLIGGSASDNLEFKDTSVFYNGEFKQNASLIILFRTNRPFRLFKTQHFFCQGSPLVVTKAIPEERIILEIDGLPAADVYAETIGVPVNDLTPASFASKPLITRIHGNEYVRSIQQVDLETKAIKLYCAIDEGVLLRIAEHNPMQSNLEHQLHRLKHSLSDLELVLIFDCILRKQEMLKNKLTEPISSLMKQHHCSGFSSFGEQFGSLHVNQTCTGIAFGREG